MSSNGAFTSLAASAPANSVIVGIPGQTVVRANSEKKPELQDAQLPDAIGLTLRTLLERVDQLEKAVSPNSPHVHSPAQNPDVSWLGEDFTI